MTIEMIEQILEEVSYGTDFAFEVREDNGELIIDMNGDNPEGEDWWETFTISIPKDKEELIKALWKEIDIRYKNFDIEKNVRLMLEAKRNGFQGVPGVVALVHNEEYKENALKEFAHSLYWDVLDKLKS